MPVSRRAWGFGGTVLAWSAAWGAFGVTVFLPSLTFDPSWPRGGAFLDAVLDMTIIWGIWGAISGATFAVMRMLLERRRAAAPLSRPAIAALGALGSTLTPLIDTVAVLVRDSTMPSDMPWMLALWTLLGAGCAAGMDVLARRTPRAPVGR